MKAVFLDQSTVGNVNYQRLNDIVNTCTFYQITSSDEVVSRCQQVDLVIANKVKFTDEILAALPNLKLICVTATGTDDIDLVAAKQQGVAVCNVPAYSTESVAQLTFTLMLALFSSLINYHAIIQAGEWQKRATFNMLDFPIKELSGKTLGIIGYGHIGQRVATIAKAFNMKVLLANIPGRPVKADRLSLNELLPQVDCLSLHCPLNENTRGLIGAPEFALMSPQAFLINVARGPIIDEQALVAALQQGQIAGAGLDVLAHEPPYADSSLINLHHPRLIITPHIAWASIEARQRCIDIVADNIQSFIEQQRLNRVV